MILKTAVVVCLLALPVPRARAATFTVNNNGDTLAAGTLRTAAAGAGAADSISWGATGGTITLGSNLPTVNAPNIDANLAIGAVTIAGAFSIPLAGPTTFTNTNTSQNWTISSNITGGAGALAKGGAGTLTLTGANTYGGGTTINAGILNVNADGALGAGGTAVTFGGGTLQYAAGFASARNFTLNAGAIFDTQGFSSSLSGVISGPAGALTKTSAGTLALNGANTYGGGTTLSAGTLNVGNASGLGTGTLTSNGGTLQTSLGLTLANSIALGGGLTVDTLGQASTLSGVISGGGTLTDVSTGTLTLTGVNTFTGGTVLSSGTLSINNGAALGTGMLTINGATLKTTAGISITTVTLNTASDTLDTQGNSLALSGYIGGSGALNIANDVGATILTFTGTNFYNGGTVFHGGVLNINLNSSLGFGAITFNGGTLQTASTVTVSNPITLNAAGGAFDTLGNASIISGVISGAGALTNASTGTLVLTAANAYTGGTTLSSGTLNIRNGSALGTNTVVFNGGNLQLGLSLLIANNMTFTKTATFDTNGYLWVLNNPAALGGGGAGGLTLIGGGFLNLAGATANYTGPTNVVAGTLQLGASGVLPAGTAMTVANGGTFDLQSFTQTVGTFVGPGTTRLTLQPATPLTPRLTVTGAANFTGGTLAVAMPSGQIVKTGDTYKPVNAGSYTGAALPTIVAPAALTFTPSIVDGGTNLQLVANLVPFAKSAVTGNQAAVAAALEPARANPSGDAALVLGQLYGMNALQLQAALDQVSPASLSAMGGIGMAGASVQSAAVSQRMAALADGSSRGGFSTYNLARRSTLPGVLYAQAGEEDAPARPPRASGSSDSPWGVFASGVGTVGRLSELNGPAGTQPGFAFNSGGVTAGADYRINENLAAGGSAGYLHGHASIYAPGAGTVDDNSARFGAYAAATAERLRANLYVGGAADSFSTKRVIKLGTLLRTASASPSGAEFNVSGSLGYDLRSVEYGIFSPFLGLNYNRLMIGSFTEDGAGALNLSVAAQTAESLQSSLGLRYSMEFEDGPRNFLPYFSLGWRHEFDDQSRTMNAQFAAAGSVPFSVVTGGYARDGTIAGSGLSVTWGRNITAKFDCAGDFRSRFQDVMFNGSVRFKF